MNILVSACLLGLPCRYNAESAPVPALLELIARHHLVPLCPEQLGGLPTPRPPAERKAGRVLTRDGADVTDRFLRGAEICCETARLFACTRAILKSKSPSCGHGRIYDGSFSGVLTAGNGLTAQLLLREGLLIADENTFSQWDL